MVAVVETPETEGDDRQDHRDDDLSDTTTDRGVEQTKRAEEKGEQECSDNAFLGLGDDNRLGCRFGYRFSP